VWRNGERWYVCKDCNKKYPDASHLRDHQRIHTGERPFTCEICSRTFRMKYYLNAHRLVHTGERPHVCSFCDGKFTRALTLLNHVRCIHTGKYTNLPKTRRQRFPLLQASTEPNNVHNYTGELVVVFQTQPYSKL